MYALSCTYLIWYVHAPLYIPSLVCVVYMPGLVCTVYIPGLVGTVYMPGLVCMVYMPGLVCWNDQRNTSCACARTASMIHPNPQVREQRQHTIAYQATARQPNPGIRLGRGFVLQSYLELSEKHRVRLWGQCIEVMLGIIRETPCTLACVGYLYDSSSPCGASCACMRADPMTHPRPQVRE